MSKKNKTVNTKATTPAPVQNGLTDALGPGNIGQFPFNQGSPYTEQLSNVNTIFKNLRWYLISNMRQVLSEAYVELGLVQAIVDIPVDDALRGGVEIKSKQLDEDQIEELQISLDRDDDLGQAGQAAKWNRLYGGAGILILTEQDPATPLDLDSIGPDSKLEFRAVDMWELFWDQQNTDGFDPQLQDEQFDMYNYYAVNVHKSRVMRLKGLQAPSFIRPRLRGWGFSVVETLVRSLNQYLKATDLGYEVLDEFKIDVYRVKNLNNTLLSPNGSEKVRQRFATVNWLKNYNNSIVMDVEDEYDQKQLSFSGIAETMDGIRKQVAADMRMPQAKLFGEAASGFSSGEDYIEVYNSMVESQVRNKLKYDVLRMIEIKCQKLFGFIPDDIQISFKPLRMMSSEQEEAVKTQKFTRLLQAKQAGEMTRFEFREAMNKGNLLDIKLDNAGDALNPDDPDVAAITEGALPEEGTDIEDPGANRHDTRKPRAEGTARSPDNKDSDKNPEPERVRTKPGDSNKLAENKQKPNQNKPPTTRNEIAATLLVFTPRQALERGVTANSAAFDRATYAADGGDDWINPGRKVLFENPGDVDEHLWMKAKDASMKAFGKEKWQFITWWYKKQGGKFHE